MQPTKLLEDLGVIGVALKYATVSALGGLEFLLLFVDVTDLEPDVLFCQRPGWVGDYIFETLYFC